MEKEITIQDLIQEVLKRWWLVALCVILFGALFFTYSKFFVAEQFTSRGSVYVDNKAQQIISSPVENNTANLYDLTTAEMLVDTYIQILSSNSFFELIEEQTGILIDPRQVVYERVEETGVIHIAVTAFSPKVAQDSCQAILETANLHIMNIMEVGSVKPIDNAILPLHRSYPNFTSTTILGMILGMLLAFAIIFLINYFDINIKTVEDIEKKYNVIVLGTIPNMFANSSSNGGLYNGKK